MNGRQPVDVLCYINVSPSPAPSAPLSVKAMKKCPQVMIFKKIALNSVAWLAGRHPTKQKFTWLVGFPVRAHARVVDSVPG